MIAERRSGRRDTLTVMQSFARVSSTTNPYLTQLVRSLPADIKVVSFSWRQALLGRYDVFHVHWPENLLRGRQGVRVPVRRALFLLLLARLRLSSVALVRTLHNERPHEDVTKIDGWMLRHAERATSLWIRLNESTRIPFTAESRTILHGHYRDWFSTMELPPSTPGRFLSFGLIRPYKGVEELMTAFTELDNDALSLHVVGKPTTVQLEDAVSARVASDSRVFARLGHVDDKTLALEIGEAELVVLPYRSMQNSGALLLALSLGRPALVPGNVITSALREEVGSQWITTFDGEVTAKIILEASEWMRSRRPEAPPDLSNREWGKIGVEHGEAYRAAVTARRSRRNRIRPGGRKDAGRH